MKTCTTSCEPHDNDKASSGPERLVRLVPGLLTVKNFSGNDYNSDQSMTSRGQNIVPFASQTDFW